MTQKLYGQIGDRVAFSLYKSSDRVHITERKHISLSNRFVLPQPTKGYYGANANKWDDLYVECVGGFPLNFYAEVVLHIKHSLGS